MTTTQDAVLRALESRVEAIFSGMSSSLIYLSAVLEHHPVPAKQYIQIVPGPGRVPDHGSGLGWIVEDVTVALFFESRLDQPGQDTTRLAKDSESLFELRNTLRGDGAASSPSGLILHTLSGILVEPIQLVAYSQASRWPDDPAWVMATDTYRIAYEIAGAV